MAWSPVGDRCTYQASSGPVNFKGLRVLAEGRGVRSRNLPSDSGQDWPSGQTRLRRGLLGFTPFGRSRWELWARAGVARY